MSALCAPQVLQRLQPGALGTVLVAGLKAERNAKDRFVIKQVRGRLLGKQDSICVC